jgi:hypothetical protein
METICDQRKGIFRIRNAMANLLHSSEPEKQETAMRGEAKANV